MMDHATRIQTFEHVSIKNVGTKGKRERRIELARIAQRATHDTTVHGIRYIFDAETEILRRLLWALVLIACASFFGQQLFVRVSGFISQPKSVDVEVVYAHSMRFPQVLLCNHNAFKITRLSPTLFRSVRTFFMAQPDQITPELVDQIARYDLLKKINTGSYTNMTQVYLDSRHSMEDMLIECKFKGRNCSAANFSVIISQNGACYQFIRNKDDIDITNPGSSSGLRLVMNIEQYAYGFGQRHSAGLDVFFIDTDEPPVISDNGVSVQPGGETSIGLDMSVMVELPRPAGDCDDLSLKYTNQYSRAACRQECLTDYVYEKCSCKTPSMSGNIPYCDLITLYNCSYPLQATFYQLPESLSCDCPPKCDEATYTPLLTYAPISQFMTSMIMQDLRSTCGPAIVRDIVKARDVLTYHSNATADITANDSQALVDTVTKPIADYVDAVKPLYGLIKNIRTRLRQLHDKSPDPSSTASQTRLNEIDNHLNTLSSKFKSADPADFCAGALTEYPTTFAAIQFCLNWFILGGSGRTQAFQMLGVNGTRFVPGFIYLHHNMTTLCQKTANEVDRFLTTDQNGNFSEEATNSIRSMVNSLVEAAATRVQPVLDDLMLGMINLSRYSDENIPHVGLEVIDETFVNDNLLKVNIYYKELNYKVVTKQLADSVVSLFCDIGGTLGLCLGASLMSIYELLDFIINMMLFFRK